jgi:hypothetical protein
MENIMRLSRQGVPKLTCYCSGCRATSTFIRIEQRGGWVCIGDSATRREGCGKCLKDNVRVRDTHGNFVT